ncbi:S8 family serine peptidase [Paucibacter sp. XJ19-41]|uniref:S8 family serine peptidase n=1 Tax=Paucibacter sp. XJ19-41 TaxID=2927824 RepID=UPI00234A2D16|nr:S8 family serine peptidase [Paucibacter sp. XJ19-41]MDC6170627.1 S8 family serine peptidase [Paucibacter sp. XJ19-41]
MFSPRTARHALLSAAAMAALGAAFAQTPLPNTAAALALPSPQTQQRNSLLRQQTGTVQVAVRLTDAPLAQALAMNAKKTGGGMTLAQRQAYMASLKSKQDALMGQIQALGGKELGRLGKAYNAVVISADAAKLPQIARLPGVSALRPVVDHQKALSSTVPYVGAKVLQDLGLSGQGVKIAVLDSGIDYTHRNLGGSGLISDFNAAAAAAAGMAPAALFPSAKVIGGYDFVGETWPNGPQLADPNPIDAGVGSGHGTHVADIAAGASLDGLHKGMAPGASLYAVKVCSSVSTSCNGLAILQGIEWAMDPNGDLDFSDAADILNLSLGASYGQRENPSTEAISNAVRFGIVAAISAGNSADRPFIVGSPSNAPEAISVAQTSMANAGAIPLVVTAPAGIAGVYSNTATLDWAPIGAGFGGTLRRAGPNGSANALACEMATTIDFTGTVALIDRGVCSISIKVANAANRGAIGVVIANNAAGDAPTFSFGGGAPMVPSLVVTQAIGNVLKSVPTDTAQVSVSPANSIPLAGSMTATSSRGPSYNFAAIKPEIGAPGASVSAVNGSGNGTESFGGTSGAAPVVAGAAALLLQKFPNAAPPEIKARLMNAANQTVYTNPATQPGVLAPISRIGAGELRVNASAALTTGLWDASNSYSPALSFGSPRATGVTTLSKKVAVRNYSATPRTYTITRSFRYADDAASGAVVLNAPASIAVPANGTAAFTLSLVLDASKLPAWNLGSAANQGNGALLQGVEFDGYITVADGTDGASVPWHVLPRKSANVVAATNVALGGAAAGNLPISNVGGAVSGPLEIFSLTGSSPQISGQQPAYGGGQAIVDLRAAGVRAVDVGGLGLQFGISTYGERAHPAYPAEFNVYVDANNDGIFDAVVYNAENGTFASSGQTIVWVQKLNPDGSNNGGAVARFFAGADLMSGTMIMTVLASDLGVTDPNQQIRFSVFAFDNYFTGSQTDAITNMVYTPATPRFASGIGNSLGVPVGFNGTLPVNHNPAGAAASPSQTGLLLLNGLAKTGREADLVLINP